MILSKPLAVLARVASPAFALTLFVVVLLNWVAGSDDPYRCKALLSKGTWLNAPDANGTRLPFTNWQPDGCMLRQYSKEDIHRCVGDRRMVFSGDSTDRQIFWAMGRLLDRQMSLDGREGAGIHESYDMTFDGIRLLQIWNPYLETGTHNPELNRELELFTLEKHTGLVPDDEADRSASIIVLGAGSWYALERYHDEAVAGFRTALVNASNVLHLQDLPFGTRRMDPREGVGNEVFVPPVLPPKLDELQESRKTPAGLQPGEVEDLDLMLAEVAEEANFRTLWTFLDLSRDQHLTIVDATITGFHVIDSVAEIKAQILLNLRCNAKLDALDGHPYDRTCCTDFGASAWPGAMFLVLALTTIYALACVVFSMLDLYTGADTPRFALLNMDVGIFAVALLFCFHADRTHLFAKGSKEYLRSDFAALAVIAGFIGLVTVRKSQPRASRKAPVVVDGSEEVKPEPEPEVEDCGVLSREQTDEWKGWMQAAILIYHWTGASRAMPVYMFIRVLVGAYLFQTGYGHTVYFLTKKDFSFRRIAATMLRLNLLSCALPYIMNTDYMLYYFAPLVSFWFMIVYATMAIGSRFNDNILVLVGKIVTSMTLVWLVTNWTPVTDWVFAVIGVVFRINWDLHEWQFRSGLDGISVYVGMLCGIAYLRIQRNSHLWTNMKMAIGPALVIWAAYAYFCFATYEQKEAYNRLHPYISFMPIVAYVGLRNSVTPLRNYYSTAFAWLGRCSLETFILQFHIYLAGDTKGVLLLDVFRGGDGSLFHDRWRDLVFIVPVFLWISARVAEATSTIVKVMTAAPLEQDYDDVEALGGGTGYKLLDSYKALKILNGLRPRMTDLRLQVAAMLCLMWFLNLVW